MHSSRFLASRARGVLAGSVVLAALLLPSGAAAANPPGNNGTIKVDRIPMEDNRPNNEPHVDCTFQIDFYGFDEGDLYARVTFEAQAPTGSGVLVPDGQSSSPDSVFIGEDDNRGGGSEAGHDASKTYSLSTALASYTAHPRQGFHVKLTVHADGSQGADTKHKVFWVSGCQPASTGGTGGQNGGGSAPGGTGGEQGGRGGSGAPNERAGGSRGIGGVQGSRGTPGTGAGAFLPNTAAAGDVGTEGQGAAVWGVALIALAMLASRRGTRNAGTEASIRAR